jgi:hypothetical protein
MQLEVVGDIANVVEKCFATATTLELFLHDASMEY